jgi:putative aldouronate transport system permease protein
MNSAIQPSGAIGAKRRRQLLGQRLRQYRSIYLMLLPVLLYFAVFSFYPLVLGLIQSLQKERLLGTPQFIGFGNYTTIFHDFVFRQAFFNSVYIGTLSLLINLFVAVVLAVCVNEIRSKFAKSAVQTVTFLPYLFSWTVVGGVWVYVLSTNGLVNTVLAGLGTGKIGFFTVASWGRPVILFTNAWKQAGYFVVLLMASIVTIDPGIFEAARIDGASRMRQITHIILPQLGPTIKTLLVIGATAVLRNFDQVFILSRPAIKDQIRSLLLYIYEEGILQMRIGKATAAATVVLLATLLISTIVRRLAGYDQDSGY